VERGRGLTELGERVPMLADLGVPDPKRTSGVKLVVEGLINLYFIVLRHP
jgi:hypothetical protein